MLLRILTLTLIIASGILTINAQSTIETLKAGDGTLLRVEKVNGPFNHPWAIAFYPVATCWSPSEIPGNCTGFPLRPVERKQLLKERRTYTPWGRAV